MFTLQWGNGETGAYLEETEQNGEGGENHVLREATCDIRVCWFIYSFIQQIILVFLCAR